MSFRETCPPTSAAGYELTRNAIYAYRIETSNPGAKDGFLKFESQVNDDGPIRDRLVRLCKLGASVVAFINGGAKPKLVASLASHDACIEARTCIALSILQTGTDILETPRATLKRFATRDRAADNQSILDSFWCEFRKTLEPKYAIAASLAWLAAVESGAIGPSSAIQAEIAGVPFEAGRGK